MLAQLGHPDMRTPIAQALAYPERIDAGVAPLDLAAPGALTFEAPDSRALSLPRASPTTRWRRAARAPAVLNAANEVAVAAFLAGRIRFTDIAAACADALARCRRGPVAHARRRARRRRGGARGRARAPWLHAAAPEAVA